MPSKSGVFDWAVTVSELVPYIDWSPLFWAWELKGLYPAILEHPKYGEQARLVLENLLEKYMEEGISELESLTVLENDPFRRLGSKANIVKFFGGKREYLKAVKELEQTIYNIA
jgi:cobalamin-dependent methionine synthase I